MNDLTTQELIKEVIEEQKQEFELDFTTSEDISFIGDNAVFTSIELISFITELESKFESTYKQEISLVNETAFSFTESPFLSLKKLTKHISSLIV